YRRTHLGNGAAERNRIQKILEDANIKLGSVLTDVFGVSGQRMLHALVESESIDVEQVAELAHWSLKPKMDSLKKALEGRLTHHHRFMIEISLDHMEHIERQILRLDEEIAETGSRRKPQRQKLHLTSLWVECAWGATKKKSCHSKSKYYSLNHRGGAKWAFVAVPHSLLRSFFFFLKSEQPYQEPVRPPL